LKHKLCPDETSDEPEKPGAFPQSACSCDALHVPEAAQPPEGGCAKKAEESQA
jgi:hypothetical protein